MPLEKLMLLVFKDIFISHLKINISQEKELEPTEDIYLTINFIAEIDNQNIPVYLHYSEKCLMKIHNAMIKKQDKSKKLEQKDFQDFSIEISNILLNRLRKYANEYDTRKVNLSMPMSCNQVKETVYSAKRYFKIDGEYFIAEY